VLGSERESGGGSEEGEERREERKSVDWSQRGESDRVTGEKPV